MCSKISGGSRDNEVDRIVGSVGSVAGEGHCGRYRPRTRHEESSNWCKLNTGPSEPGPHSGPSNPYILFTSFEGSSMTSRTLVYNLVYCT